MSVSEEPKPFDGIVFRIYFNLFPHLNLLFFFFQREKEEGYFSFFKKNIHEVPPLPLLSILFCLKFPQVCDIVTSAEIVLRLKWLFLGKLASGEYTFDQP